MLQKLSELNTLTLEKLQYLHHYQSDKGFEGTVANLTCPFLIEGNLHRLSQSRDNRDKRYFFLKIIKHMLIFRNEIILDINYKNSCS